MTDDDKRAWWCVLIALVVYVGMVILACHAIGLAASAQESVWINGHCFCDGEPVVNVTVRAHRKTAQGWQPYPPSSTTKDRGIWGIGMSVVGVSWLRFVPAAPPGYTLYGARYPGGYHARYVPGVGIELPAPSANAGHFDFLFKCQQEATPTPTVTATPTSGPLPTQTPFPGVEPWDDAPIALENAVAQTSLDLVAGWLHGRGPLYWFAWDHGLGPFPVYGPRRMTYVNPSGEQWTVEYILYPGGHVVWCDIREPTRVRITQVDPFIW